MAEASSATLLRAGVRLYWAEGRDLLRLEPSAARVLEVQGRGTVHGAGGSALERDAVVVVGAGSEIDHRGADLAAIGGIDGGGDIGGAVAGRREVILVAAHGESVRGRAAGRVPTRGGLADGVTGRGLLLKTGGSRAGRNIEDVEIGLPQRRAVERDACVARRHVYRGGLDQVAVIRSEEHTSELQSPCNLVC